jgi:hypothetical protein
VIRRLCAGELLLDLAHSTLFRVTGRLPSLRVAFVLAASLVASVAACGPSFQAVYECDVKFEHCYAMDENPVSRDAKRDCWRTWLHAYTFGQPRDRVEYATTRVTQLSLDPSALAEATDDGGLSLSTVAAAAPTNAFAPPPNVAAPDAGAPTARLATVDAAMRAPGAECSDACTQHWASCHGGCADAGRPSRTAAGPKALTCTECDRAYKICVPACFRDGPVSANTNRRTVE